MHHPKISIIIPVYNVEKYLYKCVDSVINQTFNNIEIILVNDGSSDRCPNICDDYAKKDNRIKVIHKKNGGSSEARNFGIKIAKGEYLMFLDSDDYWDDYHALEIISQIITKNSVDLIIFGFKKLNLIKGNVVEHNILPIINEKQSISKTEMLTKLISNNELKSSACTKIVKKNIILQNHIFFKEGFVSEDIEWSARVILHSNIIEIYNNSFLIYVNQRKDSITSKTTFKSCNDYLTLLHENIEYINNHEKCLQYKKLYLSYWAYQYSILLGLITRLPRDNKYFLLKKIKQYRWLLNYDLDKKVKRVNKLYKLLGFYATVQILGIYLKLKFMY